MGTGSHQYPVMDTNTTGEQRAPNPSLSTLWNVVSPYRSFRKEGREAARPTNGDAGKGVGKSECRPAMGRIRVVNITRRESELTSLRCLDTRTMEESIQKVLQMSVACATGATFPARASTSV